MVSVIATRSATGLSAREQTEECLERIDNPAGEGARAFTAVYREAARAQADQIDILTAHGVECGPLAGMTVSVKDLFDIKGEPTLAGSIALRDAQPADRDAEIVRRLRRSGAVILGKTNMTEFAFSGLGLNPHYGTPLNPWRRDEQRIPGGSSSGAGVSVADGMAQGAIGTDTGGSVRIPAAMCGLVGFKPSARSVPLSGTMPLSSSYDSIGPIARDVESCAALYRSIADDHAIDALDELPPSSIALGLARNYCFDGIEDAVAATFETAIRRLIDADFSVKEYVFPAFDRIPEVLTNGGLVAAEAYAWHRALIDRHSSLYDPRVLVRILRGRSWSYADYTDCLALRGELCDQGEREIRRVDAVLMPTIPLAPPRITDLEGDDEFSRVNLLTLRNPTIANVIDLCAISIPCHRQGDVPVGLMLLAPRNHDSRLLAIARSVERSLESIRAG